MKYNRTELCSGLEQLEYIVLCALNQYLQYLLVVTQ